VNDAPDERAARARANADQEYADAYADGYGEGLREALREMLQHASRGHTAQEIRLLVESRLARVRDDVDLKRRNLLAPPPRAAYAPLFRSTTRPATSGPPTPPLAAGGSYLVAEPRPDRALRLLADAASRYPRVVVVAFHPPALPAVPPEKVTLLPVGVAGTGGGATGLGPEVIAGRIREATTGTGGAVVYVDALEVLATEGPPDAMLRFIQWTAQEVARTGSILIASVGPESFDARTRSTLARAFSAEA